MFDQERFDELAKGLATNRLSRRQVLKNFAAGLLLAGPLGALWGREASAQQPGTCSMASRCPNKEYCSADQSCVCIESTEGDIRCGKIPSCGVRQCQTSADCADLGAGYFCDTPYSGCCSNPPPEVKRCIAPCDAAAAPCPPERVCGATCCPVGQSCINGVCSEETPVPCADDPVTSASLNAADSALAAGATQVKLSPKGCMRFRRTLTGGRLTSSELTLEGKPAIVWKHTPTKSTGQQDADLDGFFERRSTVQRGAATGKKDRTVMTEYLPATKKPARRETYTRTGASVWHVLFQQADQSGTLVTVAEFDMGPAVATTSRDQGSGGNLPNGGDRMVSRAPKNAESLSVKQGAGGGVLQTDGCRGDQPKHLEARLQQARNQGFKCLQKYFPERFQQMVDNWVWRPVVIRCRNPKTDPKLKKHPEFEAYVEPDSVTKKDPTVRITVNTWNFFKGGAQNNQASTLFHELLHLLAGDFRHDPLACDEECENLGKDRVELDRIYACENLCFGKTAGREGNGEKVTKCSCDICLGPPKGQKCNERCRSFEKCNKDARTQRFEERCCPPPKTRQNGVCQPPPNPPPPPGNCPPLRLCEDQTCCPVNTQCITRPDGTFFCCSASQACPNTLGGQMEQCCPDGTRCSCGLGGCNCV
jgi:hypothetical protein